MGRPDAKGRWSGVGGSDLERHAASILPPTPGKKPSQEEQLFETQLVRDARALRIPRPKHALDEAREFGGWTLNKLDVLALYLRMYRRVAGNGTFIDGFAGTGTVKIRGSGERPGSASVALE